MRLRHRLLPVMIFLSLGLALAGFAPTAARAAQEAIVLLENAEVHHVPDRAAPVIVYLPKGSRIRVSSDTYRKKDGEHWFKTRLQTGEFGYIRANYVLTGERRGRLIAAGMGVEDAPVKPDEDEVWTYLVRVMGLGGYGSRLARAVYGGEAEVSLCLASSAKAYERRMLGLGIAYANLRDTQFFGVSFVFRFFQRSITEPEIRLRLGWDEKAGSPAIGVILGLRYPFSLTPGPHFAAYIETGGMTVASSKSAANVFGSLGLGYHF